MHAVARPPLQGAARRRPPPPPRLARRLDRARPRAGRRDRRRARARRPPGRAGDGAPGRAPARPLPRRGGASARPAASSPGCWRPAFGEHEDSRAAGARDRRLGAARRDRPGRPRRRRPRPGHRLQALRHGHPAREARGAGEAAAAALPDRRRRALGRGAGRRPLPPAARDLGRGGRAASSLDEAAERPRRLRPLRAATWSTREGFEELLGGRAAARRRDRRPDARAATSAATPGPRPGLRGHDVCPAFCDFAPICRRDRAPGPRRTTRSGGSDERARARPPSRRRRSRPAARDVLLEAGAGTGKTGVMVDRYCRLVCERGRLPRRDPRLHLHRQGGGRAAPADPRRAGAARRGGLGARAASCWRRSAAPG